MAMQWTARRLLEASLVYFWRTNLAMALGVAVGAAVIGGALIVGDSIRASLRAMTLQRLGPIDFLISGPRFFREDLVSELQPQVDRPLAPAIVLLGGAETQHEGTTRRAGHVNCYGLEAAGWKALAGELPQPSGDEVVLNAELASALNANVGATVSLWLELPSAVPRDTLLGKRDNDAQELILRVTAIVPDSEPLSRLGFQPTQQLPLNAYLSLERLQEALDLEQLRPTRSNPTGSLARINTLLAFAGDQTTADPAAATALTAQLRKAWTLADLNLRIVTDADRRTLSIESEQMILENRLAEATEQAASKLKWPTSPVMVYLANWLRSSDPSKPKAFSMYSTVAGLDVLDLQEPPFGPWEFVGPRPQSLAPGEVILNDFLAEDLQTQVGDTIRYGYHLVGSHGELPEKEGTAIVRGIVKLTGPAADQGLTPRVKGITDAESLNDWDQPFPMKLDDVTPRDDEYWDSHRATPKVFFGLKDAQTLWPSRYGSLTSIRVAIPQGLSPSDAAEQFATALLTELQPAEVGLAFQAVKADGLAASNGATDFTGLFIGFSFFLILSAMILVGLLFRLGIEQRVRQWGLLGALGIGPKQLRRWMFAEAAAVIAAGSLLGGGAAIGYANLMLYGLRTWWIGAIGTKFLLLDVQPLAVCLGMLAAAITSFLAVVWGERQMRQVTLRQQLLGQYDADERIGARGTAAFRAMLTGGIAAALVGGSIVGVIPNREAFGGLSWQIVAFFLAGMLGLTAGLNGFSAWLQAPGARTIAGRGVVAMLRLGVRNAARKRSRSVLTAGLIASAAFVIAAVAAGHKNPASEQPDQRTGNGGFTLVAESSSPILYDLNSAEGRKKLNLVAKTPAQQAALDHAYVHAFRVRPGEDASCLNLYQTRMPTLLGAPKSIIEGSAFHFVGVNDAHPWQMLKSADADTAPAVGDLNTLMFNLKKGVGSTIELPTTALGTDKQLQIVGMLDGSIFQGVLVIDGDRFRDWFPEQKGFQYFLIGVPLEHAEALTELLETELSEYGFDVERVADRLARFLAVQNTYLSTFQALGGLGLLLGTLGLAAVMLRNVLERRSELALFRAVGFRSDQLAIMILGETVLLLGWGLVTGTGAALLAMTPHLLTTGAEMPWGSGGLLLVTVSVAGLLAAIAAVRIAIATPIVSTLRGE